MGSSVSRRRLVGAERTIEVEVGAGKLVGERFADLDHVEVPHVLERQRRRVRSRHPLHPQKPVADPVLEQA
jgi:hypothetical protein